MAEHPGWAAAARQYLVEHETKLRFLVVGGVNTLFGLAAYPVLYVLTRPLQLHYLLVLLLAQAVCMVVSFMTSKHFVFRTRGNHLPEFGRFITFHLAHLGLNLAVLPVLVELLGLNPAWAQSGYAAVVVVSSYFWHSRVTFAKPASKQER